jgi:hypothetical protein
MANLTKSQTQRRWPCVTPGGKGASALLRGPRLRPHGVRHGQRRPRARAAGADGFTSLQACLHRKGNRPVAPAGRSCASMCPLACQPSGFGLKVGPVLDRKSFGSSGKDRKPGKRRWSDSPRSCAASDGCQGLVSGSFGRVDMVRREGLLSSPPYPIQAGYDPESEWYAVPSGLGPLYALCIRGFGGLEIKRPRGNLPAQALRAVSRSGYT